MYMSQQLLIHEITSSEILMCYIFKIMCRLLHVFEVTSDLVSEC